MLGKRVRKLRLEKGLSLSELSQASGVAKSYLSTLERDIQSNPSIQLAVKIAAALDISLEQLVQPEVKQQAPLSRQDWYELFEEAANAGISREELKRMIELQKR
ncbi:MULTISPECIES: helix-turn-helix domain-containing protein [Paenibacillus]|uniref:Helix-turn-helix domain-containing protein n=1 Tax=Paenibacillus vulneris TaxID=1133364 RepID=A0ABW3UUI6_9BACL|nr:helix-turn-helix transcriptional regulator [Paenibacillus sp. 32352]